MFTNKKIFFKKKILIYGLGKTGISSYHFLKKYNDLNLFDDNKITNKKYPKKFFLSISKIKKIKFDYILISPGINIDKCKLRKYLKKNLQKIITDLDVFYCKNYNNRIIAITGTNGKSTTAYLTYLILKKQNKDARLCGNIGNPILLEKKISKKTIFVVEVSSYQIEYSKFFKANFAIILNISPDHLERHRSMKNYIDAKFKLIKNQSKGGFAFINEKDKYLKSRTKKQKILSKITKVSLKINDKFKNKINNPYFSTKGNQENLSFIFHIIKKLKLKNKDMIKTINNFKGLKYRQQIIYKNSKICCINDSKATSFSSSIDIMQSKKEIFWIVGGIPKLGDKFYLSRNNCKNIKAYIFGRNKKFFIKQFRNKISYYCSESLSKIIQKVLHDIKNSKSNLHKTILFSPSAASFDTFNNFEERGDYFNFLLKKYKVKKTIDAII